MIIWTNLLHNLDTGSPKRMSGHFSREWTSVTVSTSWRP